MLYKQTVERSMTIALARLAGDGDPSWGVKTVECMYSMNARVVVAYDAHLKGSLWQPMNKAGVPKRDICTDNGVGTYKYNKKRST